ASRFWAVLIGINEYVSYLLHGSVPDIQLMEKYLTEGLGVPRNHIQLLVRSNEHLSPQDSKNPSHARIVATLLSLITNSEITYGDNIIIYYSGHGSSYPLDTEEDGQTDYIQALCPIDRDTPGENGKPVPDISDREFNTILSLISRAKGHHITVILDCCYSGGVSRNIPELGARTSPPMKRATPQEILIAGEKNLVRYPDYRSILEKE
ncbi:caspase domain-containing protein, partial [Armillaria luteobubalina]